MSTNNGEITGALGINFLSNFLDKILSSNLQFKSMETKIAKIFCLFLKQKTIFNCKVIIITLLLVYSQLYNWKI